MTALSGVYVAGPEVFLPDAAEIGARKKDLCGKYGFVGLFPIDNKMDTSRNGSRPDHLIFHANVEMIRRCDLGICNLTPFRGVSADAGTVFELGMLAGLGKPAFGYSNDPDDYLGRSLRARPARKDDSGIWRDHDGMSIEDFGNADNLMIDTCLAAQGRPLIRLTIESADRFRDLRGFEACLEQARREVELTPQRAP